MKITRLTFCELITRRVSRFAVVLSLSLLSGPVFGVDAPVTPKPPPRPVVAATAATAPCGLDHWQHLLVKDRKQREALGYAQRSLATGNHGEVVATLEWLLSQPRDSFIVSPEETIRSTHASAERLIEEGPAELKVRYQRTLNADAARWLDRAQGPHDVRVFLEVLRRFPQTESAQAAATKMIALWLDQGNVDLAAALAVRTLALEPSSGKVPQDLVTRAIVACRLAGRHDDVQALVQRFPSIPAEGSDSASMIVAEWPQLGGDARRSAQSRATAPLLRPSWQRPLFATSDHRLQEDLQTWSSRQRDESHESKPTAVPFPPIVAAGQVLVRDPGGIAAYDQDSGRPLWRFSPRLTLQKLSEQEATDVPIPRTRLTKLMAENLVWGGLASDGRRVFLVDHLGDFSSLSVNPSLDPGAFATPSRFAQSLVAINLPSDTQPGAPSVAWTTENDPHLAGHVVLGPPVVTPNVLYCMTEAAREIFVAAIDPVTGRTLWLQPVAEAEQGIGRDEARASRGCWPTVSNGLVLCPTQVGLLVAVDAVTGVLRWVHCHLTCPTDSRPSQFRPTSSVQHQRHPALPSLVQVRGNRVITLPSQADYLFCLDIATGQELWRTAALDGEYVAAADDRHLVVVGRTVCRGLLLDDGSEIWRTPLPGVPTGLGLPLAKTYLLPLDGGRLWEIDVETGRVISVCLVPSSESLGHLAVTQRGIVSSSLAGVTVFPQSQVIDTELQAAELLGELTPEQRLQAAEVALVRGQVEDSVTVLELALRGKLADADRSRAELLLREGYHYLLGQNPAAQVWLTKLEPLSQSPTERARWLMRQTQFNRTRGHWQDVVPRLVELAAMDVSTPLPSPADPQLLLTPTAWIETLRQSRQGRGKDLADLEQGLAAAAQKSPVSVARNLERLLEGAPAGDRVRTSLVTRNHQRGEWHAAEVRLLRASQRKDPETAAQACRQLAELYSAAGLNYAAADRLQELAESWSEPPGDDGLTGREVLAQWPRTSLAWQTYQRRLPPTHPPQAATVTWRALDGSRLSDPYLSLTEEASTARNELFRGRYAEFDRVWMRSRIDAPFEWFTLRTGEGLSLYPTARDTAQWRTRFPLGVGTSTPTVSPRGVPQLGQSVMIGMPGEVRCLSLLEPTADTGCWRLQLPAWQGRTGQPLIGPSSPHLALFQLRGELAAVDPADGRALWLRSGLDPSGGLLADPNLGLIADDRRIFLLGSDKLSYRILSAETGELEREGRLNHDLRQHRFAASTLLVNLAATDQSLRIRVWDPLADQVVLEDDLLQKNLVVLTPEGEVAWITPEPRLKVFHPQRRDVVVEMPLDPGELDGVASLKVFRQGSRYFVNFMRNLATAEAVHHNQPLQDSRIESVPMRDDVLMIEPGSTAVSWRQTWTFRSVLQWGSVPAPVLIGVSLVRDRREPVRRTLSLEVLDAGTGQSLGRADRLPISQLQYLDYDSQTSRIRLIGQRYEYQIQLHDRPLIPTVETAGG